MDPTPTKPATSTIAPDHRRGRESAMTTAKAAPISNTLTTTNTKKNPTNNTTSQPASQPARYHSKITPKEKRAQSPQQARPRAFFKTPPPTTGRRRGANRFKKKYNRREREREPPVHTRNKDALQVGSGCNFFPFFLFAHDH